MMIGDTMHSAGSVLYFVLSRVSELHLPKMQTHYHFEDFGGDQNKGLFL
jgi:hypothetical protein